MHDGFDGHQGQMIERCCCGLKDSRRQVGARRVARALLEAGWVLSARAGRIRLVFGDTELSETYLGWWWGTALCDRV